MPTPLPPPPLHSFPPGGSAVIVGAQGGIGGALCQALHDHAQFALVHAVGRSTTPALDLLQEDTVANFAQLLRGSALPLRLVIDATGFLHSDVWAPEKSWRELDPAHMAHSFAVNATGSALLMKHVLPLLTSDGKAVFASLSAKVGSIGDNQLGGWYSYRASKAALNQLVHTAAIELRRKRPGAVCVTLHPGTVDTALSAPFSKSGLDVRTPDQAAVRMLALIDTLTPGHSGGFFHHDGTPLPW